MNNLIKYSLPLFFLFSLVNGYCQPTGSIYPPTRYERGYIYLKDGTLLKGKYIYSSSLEKIRVVSGKESRIFDASEVEKITTKRPLQPHAKEPAPPGSTTFTPSLWFNHTELGVLAGNNQNNQTAPLVFGTSLNRIICGHLSAGVGFGAEFLTETYIPLTLNVMYRLRNTRLSPFAMVQGGYQIPAENSGIRYYQVVPYDVYSIMPQPVTDQEMKAKGGFLFNPSFGIMRNFNRGFGMSLAFGYRFHRLRYTGDDNNRLDADFSRLSLKLGFIFN